MRRSSKQTGETEFEINQPTIAPGWFKFSIHRVGSRASSASAAGRQVVELGTNRIKRQQTSRRKPEMEKKRVGLNEGGFIPLRICNQRKLSADGRTIENWRAPNNDQDSRVGDDGALFILK